MANYHNFKSTIGLEKSPLVKDSKKSRSLPSQRVIALTQKTANLEVCIDGKKHGIDYFLKTFQTTFVQTLDGMCLGTEMVHQCKQFVFHGRVLLSLYLRENRVIHKDKKETGHSKKKGRYTYTRMLYTSRIPIKNSHFL